MDRHGGVYAVGMRGRPAFEQRHRWTRGAKLARHGDDVLLRNRGDFRRPRRRTVLEFLVPPLDQILDPVLLEARGVHDLAAGLEAVDAVLEVADEFLVPQTFGEHHVRDRERERAVGRGLDEQRAVGGGGGGIEVYFHHGNARTRALGAHRAPGLHVGVEGPECIEEPGAKVQQVVGIVVVVGVVRVVAVQRLFGFLARVGAHRGMIDHVWCAVHLGKRTLQARV